MATQANAGGLSVSPTRVELDGDKRIVALSVRNSTDRDVSFQLEAMRWSQPDGEDHYGPTAELLGTPPVFSVPAGERQIVRVGLRRPPERDRELSYRLFVQELAPPTPEGHTGLRIVLRMGVPVFVGPASGDANHELDWRASLDDDGQLRLNVANLGNGHAQVTELRLSAGERHLQPGGMFYVLPGAERTRMLPADAAIVSGTELELSARINRQPVSARLRVD